MSCTARQAAEKTGRSIHWLRTHACGWCDQTALDAVRYGCCAIDGRCNPLDRLASEISKENR